MNANQLDLAMDYLEKAMTFAASDFVFIHMDPSFLPLHGHPRFQKCTDNLLKQFPNHRQDTIDKPRYANSNLSKAEASTINDRLLRYMEAGKPYLENHLSLRQLAEELDVNANYLSQVINEKHGKNFFEFINCYRVNELKKMMDNPNNRQFTLLAMAFDCGFNSKTTFNTAFKRITGLTPSQYLKKAG